MRRLEEVAFWREYVTACRSASHEPPKALRGQIGRPTLELPRAEAFTVDEWKPLLTILAKDTSLHYIAIGATSTRYKVLEGLVFERDVRGAGRRTPALYTKYLMGCLASSLSSTVASSKCLTSILLSKIPIKGPYLKSLCQGISKTRSLQHLAFHHCPVEDSGCDDLCKCLASRPTLTTLDLTDCALSHQAAEHLAELIKKQCCVRVSEVWKGSLRYGQPVGDDMPGLRRITLNLNSAIGDTGIKALTSALQDDIWIKGVDMQGCGIGEEGACSVADLLEVNHCLTVFDLRGNPKAAPILPSLMTRLRSNLTHSRPGQMKCRWMEEVEPPSARVSQMTLAHTGPPSSRGSITGSVCSFKTVDSNSSEPPWLTGPKKSVPTKKQGGKGVLEKTKSLEVGVHKLRFISLDTPPASQQQQQHQNPLHIKMVSEENLTYNRDLTEDEPAVVEEERRQPMIAVSREQYEILNNFKKFTQSFVKTRDEEQESRTDDTVSEMRGNTEEVDKPPVEMGAGDCVQEPPKPVNKPNRRLDAGDAAAATEGEGDFFKERAHQLLRKLIKIRNDRGLEKNEGVMRVCSQLSLPESKCMKEGGELPQPSASSIALSHKH